MCLALPYKIKSVQDGQAFVFCPACETESVAKSISLDLVDGLKEGDYVLVQNNTAVKQVPEKEANEIFKLLK